jgi:hypothetical protein
MTIIRTGHLLSEIVRLDAECGNILQKPNVNESCVVQCHHMTGSRAAYQETHRSYYTLKLMTAITKAHLWLLILKVKSKVVPVFFNWAPRHEDVFVEWRYSSTHSLISALDGGEWSASRSGRFTPRERVPGTHWIECLVGPEPFWTRWWRERIPAPAGTGTLEPTFYLELQQISWKWLHSCLVIFICFLNLLC